MKKLSFFHTPFEIRQWNIVQIFVVLYCICQYNIRRTSYRTDENMAEE